MKHQSVIEKLLASGEPSIRWKTRALVLGEDAGTRSMKRLQREIKDSPRARALLSRMDGNGRIISPRSVYDKWQGAHWVLASLAGIGYPPGDRSLHAARDQVLDHWLSGCFCREFEVAGRAKSYRHDGVPVMRGRHRRCASQQGNALLSLLKLGLDDKRIDSLAERLLHWQWPDGGWNCDRNPGADSSSFMETLLPMRALGLYASVRGDAAARRAALKASEVFLERKLFKRRRDGRTIRPEFAALHYPLYWHYDILGGLVAMAEMGLINDPRCNDALDLLERKRLPDGGWPAEKRYYKASNKFALGADYVDWGGSSIKRMNEWVTVDALHVLKAAGRL